jgi:C-terminal processing protease CtpA/Prc
VKNNESGGDLGFSLRQLDFMADPEKEKLAISHIRPGSPAARAGLRVGDHIVSIDGQSVLGKDAYLYHTLTRVPAGATLRIGLANGKTISLTAASPLDS